MSESVEWVVEKKSVERGLLRIQCKGPAPQCPGLHRWFKVQGKWIRANLISTGGEQPVLAGPIVVGDIVPVDVEVHALVEREKGYQLLQSSDVTPYLVYNVGVHDWSLLALVSLLRWDVPKEYRVPKIVWVAHSPEELACVVLHLQMLPPRSEPKWRLPVLTVVLSGPVVGRDHRENAAILQQLLPKKSLRVFEDKAGADSVPLIIRSLAAEFHEKSICVESFGCREMHQQLQQRVPEEWSMGTKKDPLPLIQFATQCTFNHRPSSLSSWVEYEPWPICSWLAPFSWLPFGVGGATMGMQDWLFVATDPLPLAMFRCAFGFLVCQSTIKNLNNGRVTRDHVQADMRFKYDYMEFLGPDLPAPYCYYMYYAMAAAGFFLMLGWPYRLSSLVFTVTYVWHFFVEATHYNNHYYLMFCVGFIFLVVDANKALVFDPIRLLSALFRRSTKAAQPPAENEPVASTGKEEHQVSAASASSAPPDAPKVTPIPYLHYFLMRGFVLFVFFYGFVAKMNNDWMSGHVMRAGMHDAPTWFVGEFCVLFMSYGGVLYDLTGPLWVCHTPLRIIALLGFVLFNTANMMMFNIGVFPWMMLGSIPLLVETHTCRRRIRELGTYLSGLTDKLTWNRMPVLEHTVRKTARSVGSLLLDTFHPYVDDVYNLHQHESWYSQPNGILHPPKPRIMPQYSRAYRYILVFFLLLVIVFEFGYPLRSWYYHMESDQQVHWTEHGRKFSWHMMSRHKSCDGTLTIVHDSLGYSHTYNMNGSQWEVPVYLHQHQLKKIGTLATYVRQLCWKVRKNHEKALETGTDTRLSKFRSAYKLKQHHGASLDQYLETTDREEDIQDPKKVVRVFADVWCALNGTPKQPFVNSSFDLSRQLPPQPPGVREPWILKQTQFDFEAYPHPHLFPYKFSTSRTYFWLKKSLKNLLGLP
ncbi:hypothetical protein DIPPA_22027 [Diplonema papillatum]|nr:hypothetical protein DIPPA_22027 [Diplonema papillatum]